ncbi:hypothetical protein COCMIDRAFT_5810 [Bipolaris oryzae ATCC 44560]|uniref:Peptide N-acetyl-beta-D-glucosaminyl asparaginase amidase A N-terminal domain-containing protein n=1 Tax=Bipolaris oryzae ATCC 44560 TaxID=930090 RepID=W6ZBZ3_COCMI|nr:uncharacterized protein COCMIDRAFT_5810 [Bipolaris oryzae ATCC 44560]EUC44959.1 hypothetical protein COCMIDRAFT_5810 [Bipolaris oryzae ATCC 44560]
MGGNTEHIAGHGYLSLGQAVNVAQNSEGGVDQRLAQFLEKRLAEVWAKLNAHPGSYVLPPDEFALLNYYRTRFGDNEIGPRKPLLQCLQPMPPVLSLVDGCQQIIMKHTFASSYGQPFIGEYNPPECSFNRVTFNFTVTSAGLQFDRLGLMFLDDTEVFRTSTAEPTQTGIIWSYVKDMSGYLSLFRTPHKIIFDLGNVINDNYTGSWTTTLTATFFTAIDDIEPADVIIPISARRSVDDSPSAFLVPETRAVDTIMLPRNAKKAVVTMSACGQAAEEFWWNNVLSSDTSVFGANESLYGHSPFREIQLLIDGQLAGVAWPFPVIFTGGFLPELWRPVVGIDAFDLQEDEIDITPFITLLNDGKTHTFEIQVLGIDDDGNGTGTFTTAIESNWVVTGKVFVWLDANNTPLTGTGPISGSVASLQLSSTRKKGIYSAGIYSLTDSVQVSRSIYIESTLDTADGRKTAIWSQNLTFSNIGTFSNKGNDQVVRQFTAGKHTTLAGYLKSFEYPLWARSSYNTALDGNVSIDASMRQGKQVQQLGDLAFPNSWKTFNDTPFPNGTAYRRSNPRLGNWYNSSSTEQHMTLSGINNAHEGTVVQDSTRVSDPSGQVWSAGPPYEELYERSIVAANGSVVYDSESYGGQVRGQGTNSAGRGQEVNVAGHGGAREFAAKPIEARLGRGPA